MMTMMVTFFWVLTSIHSFLTVGWFSCWVLVWETKTLPKLADSSFPAPCGWY